VKIEVKIDHCDRTKTRRKNISQVSKGLDFLLSSKERIILGLRSYAYVQEERKIKI